MLLICPKCQTKNFLDPYPFWNFKGKTKCASCSTIWQIETAGGASVRAPQEASGTADLGWPGSERADSEGWEPSENARSRRPSARLTDIPIF